MLYNTSLSVDPLQGILSCRLSTAHSDLVSHLRIYPELSISEETVKIHRGRVMKKLEIESVAELVRLCEKAGIPPT